MSAYPEVRYPADYFDPPELEHCPNCERCATPVGHCLDTDCAPVWRSEADTPKPDEHCACDCERCLKPWVAVCDDDAEHHICERHGRDY